MKEMGIKHFRLSISWPRVLANGTVDSVNPLGVAFYNKVLDSLIAAGIDPWVTLYHWDLPSALHNNSTTGGWLNPNMPTIFNAYADFCFKTFGAKVKHWITINEPSSVAWLGYGSGQNAPGRCSPDVKERCLRVGGGGNSSYEPNIVSHHLLLAHAMAYRTYKNNYTN
jgi:beta-glucosidase/6-phospho-beta-glucosidase/beta-galactosidase